jgi:hypothetical protein
VSAIDPNQEKIAPVFSRQPDQPNGPEVSGTSFPLLATVLAGFAITIAVQLILQPADDASTRVTIALVSFLLSTLLFLSSIGFALNAQANNFLPFLDIGPTGRQLLHIDDRSSWIRGMVKRWVVFHAAAMIAFYVGIALLLAGVNLIVWVFVNGWIALILLTAILINLAVVIYLQQNAEQMGEAYWDLERGEPSGDNAEQSG